MTNNTKLGFIFLVLFVFVFPGFAEAAVCSGPDYDEAGYRACLEACPSLGCQDVCTDKYVFGCPEKCVPKTSCTRQFCTYGGDLRVCTETKEDCSTSQYTTGSCNPKPAPPPPPVLVPETPKPVPVPLPPQPEPRPAPSLETPQGQCASWKKSGQERYRGDEMTILTDVASVECEVRTRVRLQTGPHQDIIENRYRYFYEGKQFCKEIIRFTNNIESARGKDCAPVPTETETKKLEFGKDVDAGSIIPLQENTRYILQMPNGQVFVKETPRKEGEDLSLGVIVITEREGMVEMSLEEGFYYFLFKKTLKAFSGYGEGTMEPLIFTRLAALRLKGTEFSVNVTSDGTTAVHVLDGVVSVSDRAAEKSVDVQSNSGVFVTKDGPQNPVQVARGEYEPWWEQFPKITPEPSAAGTRKSGRQFGMSELILLGLLAAAVAFGIRYLVPYLKRSKT